jgi:hypothetical protein
MAGRPRALTNALAKEFCERIADGETVRQIAASEHMPTAGSIYLALASDAQLSEQYARAREAQLARWEDELLEISDDGTNDWVERENKDGSKYQAFNGEHVQRARLRVDSRKWLMSKRLPKKYGDRVALDGDGEGGPIKHAVSWLT